MTINVVLFSSVAFFCELSSHRANSPMPFGSDFDFCMYIGGGTYFRCLQKTIKLKKGQILVHPGALFHKAVNITGGMRELIVCFVDGFDPYIEDPSSYSNEDDGFEQNIVTVDFDDDDDETK